MANVFRCLYAVVNRLLVSNWLSFSLVRDAMPSIYTVHQGFYSLCCKVQGFEKPLLVPQRHLHCARLVALLMIDASGRDVAERHIGDGTEEARHSYLGLKAFESE